MLMICLLFSYELTKRKAYSPFFPMFSSVSRLARVGVHRRYYHTVKLSLLV
ncbi:hypothetical protein F383_37296 [Gossypium arboreum]|uniref:Uncharacterized protein n=1 Tax=Gossypium arboreum TaxID=29729 RepID=A0A0B0NHI1_GOSAR|nr:hypothetical protein F383_37296 [Gossypium arboreum]